MAPPSQVEDVRIEQYTGEEDLPAMMHLIDNELSEPYSIFTYRYFLHTWPQLCMLARTKRDGCVGCTVCKQEQHRGYIAMVVVAQSFRSKRLGTLLVRHAIEQMRCDGATEVSLEAEATNISALKLYTRLGFIRDKRLQKYYLSGSDAFRLKLVLCSQVADGIDTGVDSDEEQEQQQQQQPKQEEDGKGEPQHKHTY